MKKRISVILVLIMILSFAAGCGAGGSGGGKETAGTITVTDDTGRTVEVPYPVTNMVLLDTGVFEVVSAMGKLDIVSGNHQGMVGNVLFEDIQDLPIVATHSEINFEMLAELQPQVVISSVSSHGVITDNEALNDFDIADVKLDLRRPRAMRNGILVMGQILGEEEKAAEIIAYYDKWEKFIADRVGSIPEEDRVKVYFEYHAGPFKTGAVDSSFYEQVELAGGINIAQDIQGDSGVEVSAEWIAEKNPDIIIREASGMGGRASNTDKAKEIYDEILSREGLEMLTAIQNRNVHILSVEIVSRPGYIVGVCYMAKWFYPELFADFDPYTVLEEYFEIFHPGQDVVGVWFYDE